MENESLFNKIKTGLKAGYNVSKNISKRVGSPGIGGAYGVGNDLFKIVKGKLNQLNTQTYERKPDTEQEVRPEKLDTSAYSFDDDSFRKGILHAENRGPAGRGENLYEVEGKTGDLGKYQVEPETLKLWSPYWLGKQYTPEEFKKSPKAQEEFFNQFLAVVERYQLTPEEAAVTWHKGWGQLGTGPRETREKRFRAKLKELMEDEGSQKYLLSYNEGIKNEKSKQKHNLSS